MTVSRSNFKRRLFMTRNKIKTIVMVIAIILALALAGGWIAQTVVTKEKQELPETETAGSFTVTPESNKYMRLAAMSLAASADDGIAAQEEEGFIITATAVDENGDTLSEQQVFDWSMAWASSNSGNVNDYVTMTKNGAKAMFTCKQAFTTQIFVTCASALESSVKATATLDYYCRIADVKATLTNGTGRSIKGSPVITVEFPSNYSGGITNGTWMTRNLDWGKTVSWGAGSISNSVNAVTFEFVPSDALKTAFKGGYGEIQTFNGVTAADAAMQAIDSYAYFCASAVSGATIGSLTGQSTLYYLLQAYKATVNQYTVNVTVHPKYGNAQTFTYTLNIEVAATQVQNINIDNASHVF